ncbi:MAG: hypothetical protein AAB295_05190 [Chloroflexota bacterium]
MDLLNFCPLAPLLLCETCGRYYDPTYLTEVLAHQHPLTPECATA